MKSYCTILTLIFTISCCFAQKALPLNFTSSESSFNQATEEYRQIWNKEGERITEALIRISGLQFEDEKVNVIIYEAPSNSGYKEIPMKLRASYTNDQKKAALIHELSHRLHSSLRNLPRNYNEHNLLFLYLYEVWTELYGESFAKEQVEVEKLRSNSKNDYKTMWEQALSHSKEKRKELLKELINKYK